MSLSHRFIAFVALSVCLLLPVEAQELLSEFSPTHFTGWYYSNAAGIDLTKENISHNRITLLTTEQGNATSLRSPELMCARADYLQVEVLYVSLNSDYFVDRLTLQIDMLDATGAVLSTTNVPAQAGQLEQTMHATIPVSRNMKPYLQFSAPRADKDNCAAVKRVRIYGVKRPSGDINNDGNVDVTDVSIIIDMVLGKLAKDFSKADFNADGFIDVSDVSTLIDKVLGK